MTKTGITLKESGQLLLYYHIATEREKQKPH